MELGHLTSKLEEATTNLARILGLLHTPKTYIYCQYCGEDVTYKGARVSNLGTAYCQKRECIKEHMKEEGPNCSNFLLPKQLQKAIKNGDLINYKRPNPKSQED